VTACRARSGVPSPAARPDRRAPVARGRTFFGCSASRTAVVVWQRPIAEPCPNVRPAFVTERALKGRLVRRCVKEGCDFELEASSRRMKDPLEAFLRISPREGRHPPPRYAVYRTTPRVRPPRRRDAAPRVAGARSTRARCAGTWRACTGALDAVSVARKLASSAAGSGSWCGAASQRNVAREVRGPKLRASCLVPPDDEATVLVEARAIGGRREAHRATSPSWSSSTHGPSRLGSRRARRQRARSPSRRVRGPRQGR